MMLWLATISAAAQEIQDTNNLILKNIFRNLTGVDPEIDSTNSG